MSQTPNSVAETLFALEGAVKYLWHPNERIRALIRGIAEDMTAVAYEINAHENTRVSDSTQDDPFPNDSPRKAMRRRQMTQDGLRS